MLRFKIVTENGISILMVRYTLLNQKTKIFIVFNDRDHAFEKIKENGKIHFFQNDHRSGLFGVKY